MKKLDKSKVYYLGDLSDEQLGVVHFNCKFKNVHFRQFKKIANYIIHSDWWIIGENIRDLSNKSNVINALELFKKPNKYNNQRIIEIQLRMQELNNEILELDDELRDLTYAK